MQGRVCSLHATTYEENWIFDQRRVSFPCRGQFLCFSLTFGLFVNQLQLKTFRCITAVTLPNCELNENNSLWRTKNQATVVLPRSLGALRGIVLASQSAPRGGRHQEHCVVLRFDVPSPFLKITKITGSTVQSILILS